MPTCRVHILSSSADRPHSSTTFTIGEQVKQEDYDRFKDDKGDLYLLVYVDEGKMQSRIVGTGCVGSGQDRNRSPPRGTRGPTADQAAAGQFVVINLIWRRLA